MNNPIWADRGKVSLEKRTHTTNTARIAQIICKILEYRHIGNRIKMATILSIAIML